MTIKAIVNCADANFVAYFDDSVPVEELLSKGDFKSLALAAKAFIQSGDATIIAMMDQRFSPRKLLRYPQQVDWDEIEKVCEIFQQAVKLDIDISFSLKNSPVAKIGTSGNLLEIVVPNQTGKTQFCSAMDMSDNKVYRVNLLPYWNADPKRIVICSGKIIFCDEMPSSFVLQLQDALKRDGDNRPIVWIHT